uniref:Beta sex pheromone n=1 Tax=Sepia officinalis TaxID=6610 RepID=H9XQ27_SEPOF|nr:beta sex pheromone precursor [Sepia officinalis]
MMTSFDNKMPTSGKSKLRWFFYVFSLLALIFVFSRLEKKAEENKIQIQKKFTYPYVQVKIPGPGATYVIWGRKKCTSNDTRVYTGYTAGQHYNHAGGGSNILCLPRFPVSDQITTSTENVASIFGVRYRIGSYNSLGTNGLFSTPNNISLNKRVVPCSVCLTNGSATIMVIPGRTHCYPGWYRQYSGYLMTAHYAHVGRSNHICVHRRPQRYFGTSPLQAFLYHVEAECGSLPCPPYCNGFELPCVVCRKCP